MESPLRSQLDEFELEPYAIYRVNARNFSYGLYVPRHAFIGVREKFGLEYLDMEVAWAGKNGGSVTAVYKKVANLSGALWLLAPSMSVVELTQNETLFRILQHVEREADADAG